MSPNTPPDHHDSDPDASLDQPSTGSLTVPEESPVARVEDLKRIHEAALACLDRLMANPRKEFFYSLPIRTPIGIVRIQNASQHRGSVRIEVITHEGAQPLSFTLNPEGKLFFDVPREQQAPRVELDTSRGLEGVLVGISHNIGVATKRAEIEKNIAEVLVACLEKEVDYYQSGDAEKDLTIIAEKILDIAQSTREACGADYERAREILDKPFPLSLAGLHGLTVDFSHGQISDPSGQDILLVLGGSNGQDVMNQIGNHRLPKPLLSELREKVAGINVGDLLNN